MRTCDGWTDSRLVNVVFHSCVTCVPYAAFVRLRQLQDRDCKVTADIIPAAGFQSAVIASPAAGTETGKGPNLKYRLTPLPEF